jgi:D-ornithine---citrate ligase
MTSLLTPGSTATAAAAVEVSLGDLEPRLVTGFRRELPRAMDIVARRLVSAAYREGLSGDTVTWGDGKATVPLANGGVQVVAASRHAFDRLEFDDVIAGDPAELLERLAPGAPDPVRDELANGTVNLALARARRADMDRDVVLQATTHGAKDLLDLWAGMDPDECGVHFERLATEGHNLHPCGRTRLGWRVGDVLAYDLESPGMTLGFVGVRRGLHVGQDIGPELLGGHPLDPDRYAVTPAHPWQLEHLLGGRYAELVAGGDLVPLDVELPAMVTAALRTLLLPDQHQFVKVSLDIHVTSTRRTISVASTRNGPALSRVLPELMDSDRVLLLAETAGSATRTPPTDSRTNAASRDRDLAAIVRSGLSGRLAPDELAVPGSALYAVSPLTGQTVLAEIVGRYARTRGIDNHPRAALSFVDEYARLLLPPVLRLATRHGIGLEVHLQNCLPTFVAGVPHRLAVRDLAGMRVHLPRLGYGSSLGADVRLWPNSVIATDDEDVLRAKVAYTAVQAHLGEIVLRLSQSHGLNELAAWSAVRSIVDEVYDELAGDRDLTRRARADHGFLTADTVAHKALLGMRFAATRGDPGDQYVRVENPLR